MWEIVKIEGEMECFMFNIYIYKAYKYTLMHGSLS